MEFFFKETKFTSKKTVLNEYEIYRKLLEMAILETVGSMPRPPLEKLRRYGAISRPLEGPGSTPGLYF